MKRFGDNKIKTENLINEFEKDLKNKFKYHVNEVKPVYCNRNTALTLNIKSFSDENLAVIKIGNYMCDGWRTELREDTVSFKKTTPRELASITMKYADKFHDLFLELK